MLNFKKHFIASKRWIGLNVLLKKLRPKKSQVFNSSNFSKHVHDHEPVWCKHCRLHTKFVSRFQLSTCSYAVSMLSACLTGVWPLTSRKFCASPCLLFSILFEKSLWSKKKIQNLSSNLRTNFYDTQVYYMSLMGTIQQLLLQFYSV